MGCSPTSALRAPDTSASRKPRTPGESFAILHEHLGRCAQNPASLTGRDVGLVRKALAGFVTKHGAPGSEKHRRLRAEQEAAAARPTNQEFARVLAKRLAACPKDTGIPALDPVACPITKAEASGLGITVGAPVPGSFARRLGRCLQVPIAELVERGVIPSSEVLAIALPQVTSQVRAAGLADPDLARLTAPVYAAFRRRRSLLLLDLQSQVRMGLAPGGRGY